MDKNLLTTLVDDFTRSVNVFITALDMNNTVPAQEALTNAEYELAALPRMLEEKVTQINTYLDTSKSTKTAWN